MDPKPMIIVTPASDPDYIKLNVEGGHTYVVDHNPNTVADAIHAINNGHKPEGQK